MNQFFYKYIDLVTIILTLAITLIFSYSTWKKNGTRLRVGLLPFVFLGPVLLLSCMFTHLAEVTFHAIDSDFTGKFSLRFHLYTLFLMPLVLGNAGVYFLFASCKFLMAAEPQKAPMLRQAALICLILFPLLWLTPLSYVMFAALAISTGSAFLVHKKRMADADSEMFSLQEAAVA